MPVVGPHKCFMVFHRCSSWTRFSCPLVCTTNALIQIVALCRKLWKIRSCSFPSRSSSSPSVRRDRFPWSHCSADHGDSPVCSTLTRCSTSRCAGPQFPRVQVVEKTAGLPSFSMQTWRRRSRSHSCNVDTGHRCSHACRFATTGALDGRDSAVNCGGSAVGTHRLACFFRAVYTGTRPGFDPRHQGGKGVAGTPGACSKVFCHPISCS